MQRALRPGRGWLHAARAAVLAGSAGGLGIAAHALSAGCVNAVEVSAALALSASAAWAVSSRERGLGTLLGWLFGTQLAIHLVLTALCGDALLHQSGRGLLWHGLAVAVLAVVLHADDAALWTADRLSLIAGYILRLLVGPAAAVLTLPSVRGPVRDRPLPPARVWSGPSPVRRGPPGVVHASC